MAQRLPGVHKAWVQSPELHTPRIARDKTRCRGLGLVEASTHKAPGYRPASDTLDVKRRHKDRKF